MWRRLIIALVALVILVGGIVGFNLFKEKAIGEYFASMKPPPVTVSVVEAEPVTWKPGFEAIGTALAAQGVSLASETSGIVKEILFNPNDKVEAGQRLVQLDDAVESADLAASQAELELAQTQLERQRTLRERGVTAINDLDVAQASASSSQAQVLKLTAVMNQKSLEAPFAGVIGIAQIDVGEFVPAGTVFATLQDLDNMRVDFSLPEQQITQVKIGMPVAATSEVGDLELRGKIIAIEPKIDQNSRLVTLRAQLDNPGQSLNPGQFIRVWVELPEEQGVMALPQTVVTSNLYGDSVFVVRTEGEGDEAKQTVEQVFVKTGRRSGELVEIREGISAGDEVVSAGQNRLTSGASVKIDNTVNPLPAAAN